MRQTFVFGRLCGVRVGVHVSWLVVFAFVTFALARALTPLPPAEAYALAAAGALALFASVLAHELAHALVARRFAVRTDSITLFLFGGVASLDEEPPSPNADALIALAGPAMSAALSAAAFVLQLALDRLVPGAVGDALALLATYLFLGNAVLAAFNLLPAYPMDGGRVLRALLWRRRPVAGRDGATAIAARIGMAFALLFVIAGVLAAAATREMTYGWYALLGAFLLRQAWAQQREAAAASAAAPAAGALGEIASAA